MPFFRGKDGDFSWGYNSPSTAINFGRGEKGRFAREFTGLFLLPRLALAMPHSMMNFTTWGILGVSPKPMWISFAALSKCDQAKLSSCDWNPSIPNKSTHLGLVFNTYSKKMSFRNGLSRKIGEKTKSNLDSKNVRPRKQQLEFLGVSQAISGGKKPLFGSARYMARDARLQAIVLFQS